MNIEKIKPTVAVSIILCASPFFVSVLSFFILSRGVFFSLNMWQMIGICMGICSPILLINTFITFLIDEHNPTPASQEGKLGTAGGVSTIIITLCLLIAYLNSFSLKKFYWSLFIFEIGIVIVALIANVIEGKNKKKSKT